MPRNGLKESTSLVNATVKVNGSSSAAWAVGSIAAGSSEAATSASAATRRVRCRP